MTPRLRDLPDDQRQAIKALAENAGPLTDRQRERLQLLFRGGDKDPPDAATPAEPGPTNATAKDAETDSRTGPRQRARGRR